MEERGRKEVLKIDIDGVLRQRLPRYRRLIPRVLVNWLKRKVHQDEMNTLLEHNAGKEGSDFCEGVLGEMEVSYRLADGDTLPDADKSRVIYISNHPLGGLDGITLTHMIARHHGMEPWFLVNDLLMAIEPLRSVFLPVNKHGRQNRAELVAIHKALSSERPVIIFPAGLCSRMQKDGSIADLEWKKKFIDMAIRYKRDIIPLHFEGKNSQFFYKFAKFRTRLGVKFNIEMIFLPDEMFKASHSQFTVYAGSPVSWEELKGGSNSRQEAARMKSVVYSLPTRQQHGKDN